MYYLKFQDTTQLGQEVEGGVKGRGQASRMPFKHQSLPATVTFRGGVKVEPSPVCGNVDLGDLEVELGGAAHRHAVTSCGKVQQLLLQFQWEGQHHVPEAPGGRRGREG